MIFFDRDILNATFKEMDTKSKQKLMHITSRHNKHKSVKFVKKIHHFGMLGLHYVPGSHGSHGSQKRSSPWCFESFLSLCSSSVRSRYVFSRSVKVCRDRGSPARYGLSRMVLRFLPACHVLLGPLTFCYVAIKFCYVYQVLSRFSTIKRGR